MNQGSGTSVDRIRGWHDIPLNAEGRDDARKAAVQLEGTGIDRVIASDLKRSEQTGGVVAKRLGVPLTTSRAFRPWHLGVLSGKPSKEAAPVIEQFARESPAQQVPEGESFNEFTGRLFTGLERVLRQAKARGETVCITTHFRDLKAIQAWLKGGQSVQTLDLDTFCRNDLSPAAILLLTPDGEKWRGQLISRGIKD